MGFYLDTTHEDNLSLIDIIPFTAKFRKYNIYLALFFNLAHLLIGFLGSFRGNCCQGVYKTVLRKNIG